MHGYAEFDTLSLLLYGLLIVCIVYRPMHRLIIIDNTCRAAFRGGEGVGPSFAPPPPTPDLADSLLEILYYYYNYDEFRRLAEIPSGD